MKRILCIIILLIPSYAFSGATYTNIDNFMMGVRGETRIYSNNLLHDTLLVQLVSRALVWTSIDAGGVETQYKFNTDTNTAFYALPDSIVQIVHATLIRKTETKDLKAWYPEFFEERYNISGLDDAAGDPDAGFPEAYNYWADTIQLMPIPKTIDSIYLKCFVEHEELVDTVGSDTMAIQMLPAFQEVAMAYACHLVWRSLDEFEKAAFYKTVYDDLKKNARAKYFRRLDVLRLQ